MGALQHPLRPGLESDLIISLMKIGSLQMIVEPKRQGRLIGAYKKQIVADRGFMGG
jgi:hypothetical protein